MDNKTQINPSIQAGASTVINRDIIEEYNAQNHVDAASGAFLEKGTVVCERYQVVSQLEVSSGEADLFLCTDGSGQYVAKIYKRKFAVKPEVINALLRIDSPYVAKLYTAGEYRGYPVEILPYYEKGSLQGHVMSEEELVSRVIPSINEGLHAIHEAGIIHKDLKPSNIMLNSDGETVSIIDFGISSSFSDESTVLITRTGLTPEYSAPEAMKNIFLRESDYYSFGITIFELFCGYTPFANIQMEELEQYAALQRIPFPENMPVLLQDLITALTYPDIRNRNDKNNPNRRWTYEEVKKWVQGEPLLIPGETAGTGGDVIPAYSFMDQDYTDPAELVSAFAKHWEAGKKQLFRGEITAYFRKWNQELARKCLAAEEEATRQNGKDDIIFWKLLYQLNPKLKGFYWRGRTYESLAAFGRDLLEKLWDKDYSQLVYYSSVLSEKLLSLYVTTTNPNNERLKKAAQAIEDSYELELNNHTDLMRTFYLMAYTLSGQKLFLLDGIQFRTVGELAAYLRKVLDESTEGFEKLCHRLVDHDGNLDFQLETWLLVLGKQKELDAWRSAMNE